MNSGIDFIRHLFALAVIVQHMSSSSRYSEDTNNSLLIFIDWIDGAVAGFLLISGYFFKNQDSVICFCKKQFVRLMIPFILFSTLYAVVFSISGKMSLFDGILLTMKLKGSSMQLYYLPTIFFITVGFSIICYFVDLLNKKYALNFLLAIFFIASLAFPTSNSSGYSAKLAPFYCLSFLIGFYIKKFRDSKNEIIYIFSLLCMVLFSGLYDKRFIDLTFVIVIVWASVFYENKMPKIRLPGSGGVYLLHTPVVNFAISSALVFLSINQVENIVISVILTYAFCLLIVFFVIRYLKEYRWIILE